MMIMMKFMLLVFLLVILLFSLDALDEKHLSKTRIADQSPQLVNYGDPLPKELTNTFQFPDFILKYVYQRRASFLETWRAKTRLKSSEENKISGFISSPIAGEGFEVLSASRKVLVQVEATRQFPMPFGCEWSIETKRFELKESPSGQWVVMKRISK